MFIAENESYANVYTRQINKTNKQRIQKPLSEESCWRGGNRETEREYRLPNAQLVSALLLYGNCFTYFMILNISHRIFRILLYARQLQSVEVFLFISECFHPFSKTHVHGRFSKT